MKLLFLFFLSNIVQSDTTKNDITNATEFRPGMYCSFDELRTNSPSIINTDVEVIIFNEEKEQYNLKDRSKKKIYGFCDGKDIYITSRIYNDNSPFKDDYYVKLELIGRYLLITDYIQFTLRSGVDNPVPEDYEKYRAVLINTNNGKDFILDKKVMMTILKSDTELFKKYKKEKKKNKIEVRVEYIRKYNERNRSEIKPVMK